MSHAENLHIGVSAIGMSLAGAIIASDQARRQARLEAQAEAHSIASVRRLANALAASQRREAALESEVVRLRFELGRARGALRRAQA